MIIWYLLMLLFIVLQLLVLWWVVQCRCSERFLVGLFWIMYCRLRLCFQCLVFLLLVLYQLLQLGLFGLIWVRFSLLCEYEVEVFRLGRLRVMKLQLYCSFQDFLLGLLKLEYCCELLRKMLLFWLMQLNGVLLLIFCSIVVMVCCLQLIVKCRLQVLLLIWLSNELLLLMVLQQCVLGFSDQLLLILQVQLMLVQYCFQMFCSLVVYRLLVKFSMLFQVLFSQLR